MTRARAAYGAAWLVVLASSYVTGRAVGHLASRVSRWVDR